MAYVDRNLMCVDCGAEFVFSAGAQVFFHAKQFRNGPKYCKCPMEHPQPPDN